MSNIFDYPVDRLQLRDGRSIVSIHKNPRNVLVLYNKNDEEKACIRVNLDGRYRFELDVESDYDIILKPEPLVIELRAQGLFYCQHTEEYLVICDVLTEEQAKRYADKAGFTLIKWPINQVFKFKNGELVE